MSEPNANAIPSTRAANRSRTHKLTISAMLSGVAFLLMFIEFPDGDEITVTPYWVTLDGTTVYGTTETYSNYKSHYRFW